MIISVFVGIYLALNSWLEMCKQEWLEALTEERIAQTEKLASDSDSEYFVTRKLLPLLRKVCDDPLLDIEATKEVFISRYGLDLVIYKFDKDGKLQATAPKNAPNQWLMRNLFPALKEKDIRKTSENSKELDKKVKFAFGYGKDLISIKNNPETIINTVTSNQESFIAWSSRSKGGVIIASNGSPDKNKILSAAIEKMPKPKYFYTAGNLKSNINNKEKSSAIAASRYLSRNSQEYGSYLDKDWYFTKTKNNEEYYTAYNISTSVYHRGILYVKILFIILIPLSVFIIINLPNQSILSLKKFVILIFIASSILPLTVMGTASLENINAIANIHRNELRSAIEESIGNIIQKFGEYLTSCTNKLNEITDPQDGKLEDLAIIEQRVTESFPESRFSARDAASNQLYANTPDFSSGQEALFKSIYHSYIYKHMPERLDEKKYNGNPFSDMILSKDDMGFNVICNYPNQLQLVNNAGSRMLFYTRLLPKEVGEVAIIMIQPLLSQIVKDYTRSIDQRSLVTGHQQINLIAFSPLAFKWIIAPEHTPSYFFEQVKAAYVLGRPIFRKLPLGGQYIYSLCKPSSEVGEVCYLGTLSTDKFQREIDRGKFYITIGASIALILLLCIISWLMKQLISPLSNLESGIKALAEHKFETKLPIPAGNDELVNLFKEFNFMMSESYDMQIAKNVQEGLITRNFPKLQDYFVEGIYQPIGKLGGNCLTAFSLPDGKLLFMIGDFTGHNVGSALMMAFVRSITFNWSQTTNNNPISLVKIIDKTLRENRIVRIFVSTVCGILNPENGKIAFVTRGHIFPLFLRNDGSAEWLGKDSLPLGIGKEQESVLQETTLLPGERLLCISDALVGMYNSSYRDVKTGYEQVEEWAYEAIEGDNKTWLERIKNKFTQWCDENQKQPIDDVTLFTIISEKNYEGSNDEA